MAKKRKNGLIGNQSALDYLSLGGPSLSDEAKKSLTAIILTLLAAISLLSLVQPDGLVGSYLYNSIGQVLGWGRWFLPIFLLALAVFIYYRERLKVTTIKFVGWGLLFIGLQSFFHFCLPDENWLSLAKEGQGGGYVGFGLTWALVKLLGYWSSLILTLAILITSLIFIFNTNLSRLLGRQSIFNKILIEPLVSGFNYFRSLFSRRDFSDDLSAEEELSTVYIPEPDLSELIDDKPTLIKKKPLPQPVDDKLPETKTSAEPKKDKNTIKTSVGKIDLPIDLLDKQLTKPESGDTVVSAQRIKTTLENFDIPISISEITVGPTITQYAIKPAEGIRLEKITGLAGNLSMALAAPHPIRIEAPIPGKSLVGIEVPNQTIATVGLRDMFDNSTFRQRKTNTMIALGKDVTGKVWLEDLASMPHLLVAGTTGSGKSVMLNGIILSLLYENSPEDLRLIMVDPKRVELSIYNDIPHLLTPVVNEASKTINALGWALNEMSRRLEMFQGCHAKDIKSYNQQFPDQKIPYIVFVIDELADLMMMSRKEVEASIIRLAQMSRAAGIHLILATQRPSVDVITGVIKGNMPARIAFTVASQVDSRTILDTAGAERLMGKGDMLFSSPRLAKPVRIQGAFVSESEIKRVVNYIKARSGEPQYVSDIVEKPQSVPDLPNGGALTSGGAEGSDDLLEKAKEAVIKSGRASATYLQRMFKIGYPRAASLLDQLEEQGVIGPVNGAKPREIYISPEEYNVQQSQAMSAQPLHNPATSTPPENYLASEIWAEEMSDVEDSEELDEDSAEESEKDNPEEDDNDELPLAASQQILADIYSEDNEDDQGDKENESSKNKQTAEFDDDE
ncbi:MAG TPA: DNA translocase FtsK 4TM domain-containing protein, partial [bacterium]|nr:DNA translocase FtsK 4TM domain-containing protein [bacterium]